MLLFRLDSYQIQEVKNNSLINKFCKKLENSNLGWVNQSKPYGFGDAVRQSEKFVGKDNFLVHGGDVAILSNGKKNHSLKTLIKLGNNSTASHNISNSYIYTQNGRE